MVLAQPRKEGLIGLCHPTDETLDQPVPVVEQGDDDGPRAGGTGAADEAVALGAGQPLRGEMLIYDALWGETRKIATKRRGDCPVCG